MIGGKRPDWFPDWRGQYVAVIGGGGSVKRSEVDSLRGRIKVIVINTSYELAPWADALYACDVEWWQFHKEGVSKFAGLKIGFAGKPGLDEFPDIKRVTVQKVGEFYSLDLQMDHYGVIGGGGFSGFQVINLCAQWEVKGIMLLGFDMCFVKNRLHWHGLHGGRMANPDPVNFAQWKASLEKAAPRLHSMGIEIVNCSMESALGRFLRFPVAQALERWGL